MIEDSNLNNKRIAEYLAEGKRFDGREFDENRDIEIDFDLSKRAEGGTKVCIGKTEVWVGVKLDIGEPYPDSPDKGNMMVTAELTPLSHGKYEYGPPKFDAIEFGRLVDRGIRHSEFIDFDKLCIKEGEKVWTVFIDIYSINDAGNLLDAAFIGAIAALKSATMPFYDEKTEKIDYDKPSKTKLPLTKNVPMNYSIYKIKDNLFIDPNNEEKSASEGRLVVGITNENPIKISSMQKGGTLQMTLEEFEKMLILAEKKHKTFFPKIMKKIDDSINKK